MDSAGLSPNIITTAGSKSYRCFTAASPSANIQA